MCGHPLIRIYEGVFAQVKIPDVEGLYIKCKEINGQWFRFKKVRTVYDGFYSCEPEFAPYDEKYPKDAPQLIPLRYLKLYSEFDYIRLKDWYERIN